MGTRIDTAATEFRRGRVVGRGALHLSDEAARLCLDRAHRVGNELDLLINTGIYRDHNLAEPALASIIQEDLGANPGHPPRFGHHGTFSFDIANGGCGVVTALQLADGFVGSGTARLALIVTGDSDPAPHTTRGFPFAPAGGALLLEHVPGETGFLGFAIRTFPADGPLFESEMMWDRDAGILAHGRNVIEITESPRFGARCLDHAVVVARELLASVNLGIKDIGVLVASQYPVDFATELARRLELPSDRVPRIAPELERTHTAGPIAALEAAIVSGQLARERHTLFVTAGAGPTIAAALYRS
jgi:3-oxoacyl-[acyl-carrier-protein] synthase-3